MFNFEILTFTVIFVLANLLQTVAQNTGSQTDWEKIRLYHYPNPLNSTERYDISDPTSFPEGKLTKGKKTKIVIHGAGGHCYKDDVPFRLVKAYLRAKGTGREDYNIMCLDYGPLSQLGIVPGELIPNVRKSYEYVGNLVADKAADLILALQENDVTYLDQFHIIGHSLGGQLSGFIGRKVQEKTNYQRKLGRITGLDIANLYLVMVYNSEVNLSNQLDLSDANFVDIIHTSPIGLRGDYGHADFYPDGGLHQQSCLTRGPVSNVSEMLTGGCSHIIIGNYWENSIDAPNTTACKDTSWDSFQKKRSTGCTEENVVTFGEYVPTNARGKFYLDYPRINPQ